MITQKEIEKLYFFTLNLNSQISNLEVNEENRLLSDRNLKVHKRGSQSQY